VSDRIVENDKKIELRSHYKYKIVTRKRTITRKWAL